MLILELYNKMVEFLQSSAILIGLLVAVVEYLKVQLKAQDWYSPWMTNLMAFVVAFVLAIPSDLFASTPVIDYVVHGVGLGLVATGLYKVGESLIKKAIPV